ncbi:MAG: hypothetical protein IJJ56_04965 [Prevotella sp.]|nr:hypothetical protein [Prevotella sp.]
MNDVFILQSLMESFDILKNSWNSKRETIINCIVETGIYDGETAMNMWLYILQNNKNKLKNKETAEACINEVLNRFHDKHKFYGSEYDYRAILEYVAPYIANNNQIIELIFGCAYNAGDRKSSIWENLIPACIAGIILQKKPHAVKSLILSLSRNMYLIDTTIGDLLRRALEFIDRTSMNSELNDEYFVTPDVKDTLLTSIGALNSAEERADCMVTILSL